MAGRRRVPFIAGNWKMNPLGPGTARDLASKVAAARPGIADCRLVLIPPFTALGTVAEAVAGTDIALGAQDLYWEAQGAYTGEISGPMLKDAGCAYVLVGHSERRQHFGETNETVNRKAKSALESGLAPIICIGEVLSERDSGKTLDVIDEQLARGLAGFSGEDLGRLVLAYEPVWAIGTGRTATPDQAEEVHDHIRRRVRETYGNGAAGCAIIYGGSVKPANSYPLFKERDIDGFLVGGASLEADGFVAIAREALRADREKT